MNKLILLVVLIMLTSCEEISKENQRQQEMRKSDFMDKLIAESVYRTTTHKEGKITYRILQSTRLTGGNMVIINVTKDSLEVAKLLNHK